MFQILVFFTYCPVVGLFVISHKWQEVSLIMAEQGTYECDRMSLGVISWLHPIRRTIVFGFSQRLCPFWSQVLDHLSRVGDRLDLTFSQIIVG